MRFAVLLCCSVQCFYVFLCGFAVFIPPLRPPPSCADSKTSDADFVLGHKKNLSWGFVAIQQSYEPILLINFGVMHLYGGPVHDVIYAIISWEKSAVPRILQRPNYHKAPFFM